MKRILTILFLLQLVYSASNAQIKLIGNITTNGKASYPTHIDSLGKGGMMVMPTIGTRDSIPLLRRKKGMLVYVEGKLRSRSYKLKTGEDRTVLEVFAEDVQLLSNTKKEESVPTNTEMVEETEF